MLARGYSLAIIGVEGYTVTVEADVCRGLPAFSLVGLPDAAIREARERVRTAIINTGLEFPLRRITVNLAPGDLRKEGPAFDLPIAVTILAANGLKLPRLADYLLVGELALDGALKPVRGVLAMACAAVGSGYKGMLVPWENQAEAAVVCGVEVIPVKSLAQALAFLAGKLAIAPAKPKDFALKQRGPFPSVDLQEIQGQEGAKRALEIAAAGGHNLLLVGPPGTGKTMLARALAGILPSMAPNEILEVNKIYSVAGLVKTGLIRERPFRNPHHSCTVAGLLGGGAYPRPGELSLAHHGVLFLDELPEFRREVLEVLRQPLEEGVVRLARAQLQVIFPARFMLLVGMNPCPCGFFSDPLHPCRCRPGELHNYLNRISGPLLDRIDIFLEVLRPGVQQIFAPIKGESSKVVQGRVEAARRKQMARLGLANANMGAKQIRTYCQLDFEGEQLLRQALEAFGWGMRAYHRVLKLARTIADLAGAEVIAPTHISEAIQLRRPAQRLQAA